MKITTIKYMERKNKGNYEHEELSAEAVINETEDPITAIINLKHTVHNLLYFQKDSKPLTEEDKRVEAECYGNHSWDKSESPKAHKYESPFIHDDGSADKNPITAPQKKPKAKKEKPLHEKIADETIEKVLEKEEKPKASKVVKYSSTIPEHKSIFGGYLAKSYGEAWKTASPVEEIKKFTASLNGQDFLNDSGTMVPTFLELVHTFFGMPTNA